MLALRHPCCALGLLNMALACQPPTPALRCSDDSDCPTDYLCDQTRRFCFVDPLARDGSRPDGRSRDSAGPGIDHPRNDTGSGADGAPTDAGSGTDRARPDVQLADTAPSDRRILDFSVSTDGVEIAERYDSDLPKLDRAGGADNSAVDGATNSDGGTADACDCVIDGGCHAALAPNPSNPCLWCDPFVPYTWSNADGEVCWGNRCSGAWLCYDGLCDPRTTVLGCNFSCDAILQQCCGEPGEPCCAPATGACTSNSYCDYGVTPAICRSPTCGAAGQVCCGIDVCNPGMVCEIGPQLCQPCGANQQFCCSGVNCGHNNVCDQFESCSPCGHTNELCCPDLTCIGAAPACCIMVWPRACTSLCG